MASIDPFFRISDPALVGTKCYQGGRSFVLPNSEIRRVVKVNRGSPGSSPLSDATAYAYERETTDGVDVVPLGGKLLAPPKLGLRPFIDGFVGFVASSRSVPVDDATKYNYQLGLGAGVETRLTQYTRTSVEYRYFHISNANTGTENPGIDFGAIRGSLAFTF